MSLSAVFNPASIAIVGASQDVGSVGNDLVKNLSEGFKGKVFPVNLKGDELYGLKMYRSLSEIEDSIDLVVIAIPSKFVLDVLAEAGQLKIKAAVVISAGFKEAGQAELEQELVKVAKKHGITLIGPNCLGVINAHQRMNASFAPAMPEPGSIALLSQSGAIGTAILDYALANNLGFSKFLSLGNKAAVSEVELLDYLGDDDQSRVILLYAEQLQDLNRILEAALRLRHRKHPKPIIVLKSGQTAQGAAAAQSHTGALAGSDAFYQALFREAGIIRADSVEELFLYAECFTQNPLVPTNQVAVVTNAGGLGVVVTDALIQQGLQLAQLSEKTQHLLAEKLPAAASVHNPVDILGDAAADRYRQALELVLADPDVDAVSVLLTPQSMTQVADTAKVISQLKQQSTKPIIVSFLGGQRVLDGIKVLQTDQVTEVDYPEQTATGLGVLHEYTSWRDDQQPDASFADFDYETIERSLARVDEQGWLPFAASLELLTACQIPVLPWQQVLDPTQVAGLMPRIGNKVVLKIASNNVLHKTDGGGVVLGVTAETAAQQAHLLWDRFADQLKNDPEAGIVVMQQLTTTRQEILIGAVRQPGVGAIVGVGRGGVHAEVFKDSTFELTPMSQSDGDAMVERLAFYPVLAGHRADAPYDLEALSQAVTRISDLITKYPQITELDINPLFVLPKGQGVVVADARLRCES